MYKLFGCGLLGAVLALSGCAKSGGAGGVAVIDLDKVATAMGWLDDMSKNLQSADAELRGQLDTLLRNAIKAIDDAKKAVANDAKLTEDQTKMLNSIKDPRELESLPLTPQQRERLTATVAQANQAWQQALNSYQQLLQGRRAQLIMSYREKVRPVARRVAANKGLTVVMTISDNLLYADPQAADITNEVIDELQKSGEFKRPTAPATAPAPAATPTAPSAATPAPAAPASSTPAK